jgi:PAS domain S-box-containing protein
MIIDMNSLPEKYKRRAFFSAVGAGLLCLFLSGFGINVFVEDIRITLVWSVIFPLIISMAYGSRYGLIAAFTGGAFFPFLLWPGNGYANILNFFLLTLLYYSIGKLNLGMLRHRYLETFTRILIFVGVYTIVLAISFLFIFNPLLSLNPPFWYAETVDYIDRGIRIIFLIKNSIGYLFAILSAELLLHLTFVRKFLGLPVYMRLNQNKRVFFYSVLTALIIFSIFILLENTLLKYGDPHGINQTLNHTLLVAAIILWTGVIVIRTLFNFTEKRLESDQIIKENEEKFRLVFENSLDAILWANPLSGIIVNCNTAATQLFDRTRDEIIGEHHTILHPVEMKDWYDESFKKLYNDRKNQKIRAQIVTSKGEIRNVIISSSIVQSDNIPIIQGVFSDITEHEKMVDALKESEQRLSAIFESANIGIGILSQDGHYTMFNRWWMQQLGYNSDELYHLTSHDITYPEDLEETRQMLIRLKTGEINHYRLEKRFVRKNGTVFWGDVAVSAIRETNGEIINVIGVINDITDRKDAELALKSSQVRQGAMIANISDVIVIIDKDGIIQYISPNIEKWFGWKPEEVIGQNAWHNIQEEDLPLILEFFDNILKKPGLTLTVECRYMGKNGAYRWIEATATNCLNYPNIDGILVNYKDISERKQAIDLEQEVLVARKSVEFKQRFLANMSHEIRTPLTGILGMAEILSSTQLDNKQKDYLNTLSQSGENLKEIINLILDYSKLEAGEIKPRKHKFRLQELILETENLFHSICQKEIQWETQISDKLPAVVISDKQRISQIIRNLLSNAVKFTDEGKITLKINPDEVLSEDSLMIKVELTDTGKGISVGMQKNLFEPFYQVEDDDTRTYEGTGLGLPICKELTALLGGQIGVISDAGKGSTFWFTFYAETGDSEVLENSIENYHPGHSKKPLNILVVEDKIVNQKVISLLLTSLGHSIILAKNGLDALACYVPGEFDLILMDIQMPVMDGLSSTQQLRRMYDKLPPIVGLSANAFEGDRERYMKQGLDEYLTKPVNITEFEQVVKKLGLI